MLVTMGVVVAYTRGIAHGYGQGEMKKDVTWR